MLENSERSVRGVRVGKSGLLERAELANQIQGVRIPDPWDAKEKNKINYYTYMKHLLTSWGKRKKQTRRREKGKEKKDCAFARPSLELSPFMLS